MLNIFKPNFSTWRNPLHWPYNIKLFFRSFKYAYQRATRGYADYDIWDMDYYLGELIPEMLRHMSRTHNGYPGSFYIDEQHDTIASLKWEKILKEIATEWEAATAEEPLDLAPNEYSQWQAEREIHLHRALELFEKYYYNLWD